VGYPPLLVSPLGSTLGTFSKTPDSIFSSVIKLIRTHRGLRHGSLKKWAAILK
jgi:hypothetical protein